jgi:hypothetical protein
MEYMCNSDSKLSSQRGVKNDPENRTVQVQFVVGRVVLGPVSPPPKFFGFPVNIIPPWLYAHIIWG